MSSEEVGEYVMWFSPAVDIGSDLLGGLFYEGVKNGKSHLPCTATVTMVAPVLLSLRRLILKR